MSNDDWLDEIHQQAIRASKLQSVINDAGMGPPKSDAELQRKNDFLVDAGLQLAAITARQDVELERLRALEAHPLLEFVRNALASHRKIASVSSVGDWQVHEVYQGPTTGLGDADRG